MQLRAWLGVQEAGVCVRQRAHAHASVHTCILCFYTCVCRFTRVCDSPPRTWHVGHCEAAEETQAGVGTGASPQPRRPEGLISKWLRGVTLSPKPGPHRDNSHLAPTASLNEG